MTNGIRKTNFETAYKKARAYAKLKLGGVRINDQKEIDTNSFEFRKRVYCSLAQDVCEMWRGEYTDEMAGEDNWLFEQNEKPAHQGGMSLKELCKTKFYNIEAEGMAATI